MGGAEVAAGRVADLDLVVVVGQEGGQVDAGPLQQDHLPRHPGPVLPRHQVGEHPRVEQRAQRVGGPARGELLLAVGEFGFLALAELWAARRTASEMVSISRKAAAGVCAASAIDSANGSRAAGPGAVWIGSSWRSAGLPRTGIGRAGSTGRHPGNGTGRGRPTPRRREP
ncbi:hypothetical protein Slala02_64310 [Streptomyces lavendulae subsp. lavendulae]|nr:hypothetical protein Slala01_67920 [Streptomyces lavendulae subsp. lavendulae]GLX30611.1 hypothetical protein Slala02_64310 [Streptomyces lavendulae subsp. lavendulae]